MASCRRAGGSQDCSPFEQLRLADRARLRVTLIARYDVCGETQRGYASPDEAPTSSPLGFVMALSARAGASTFCARACRLSSLAHPTWFARTKNSQSRARVPNDEE